MFLQVCVILFTGGVSASVHAGILLPPWGGHPRSRHPPWEQTPQSRHPLGADNPWEQTPPRADTPWEQTPPRADSPWEQRPPRADTHPEQTPPPGSRHPLPGSRYPPGKQTTACGQRVADTHPTGMHSSPDWGNHVLPRHLTRLLP